MPPPLRYPSYRPRIPLSHSPPRLFVFVTALVCLLALTACPEPLPSEKADEVATEASIEKTDSTPEESKAPEEIAAVEESTTPDDGGTERTSEQAPDDPNAVVITSINGNGSERPITYGNEKEPNDAKEATHRFTDSWIVVGQNLDKVTEWRLQHSLTNQSFTLASDNKDSVMISLKLPPNLVAGAFLLIGLISAQTVVRAQTFVLQGEKGDSRFSESDATLLQALLTKLKSNGNTLEITASQIILKENTNTTSATISLGAQTTTLNTENFTLVSKEASLQADTKIEITTPAFSVKSIDNNVSLELDAASREIRLQAANGTDTASFTLKHESTNAHPSATFRNLNLHLQSGAGVTIPTTPVTNNGRGNLIIGYNENTTNPQKTRTGSHNLVLGTNNEYTAAGSILSGANNTVSKNHGAILAGQDNKIDALYAAAIAGQYNEITGNYAATLAGGGSAAANGNKPQKDYSAVVGGSQNAIGNGALVGASICGSRDKLVNSDVPYSLCCAP